MQFTVANWHARTPAYWLTHGGYTIMASPPDWAKEAEHNLALFAPPASIVFGRVSVEEYITVYRQTMKERLPQIRAWRAAQEDQRVTLLCACPEGRFCHRLLVAKLLCWLGCEQVPLWTMPDGGLWKKAIDTN